jgi:LPS-assembly protein
MSPSLASPSFVPGKDLRAVTPLDVKSDYGEVFDNEISSYFGNVEVTRADQRSLSNAASYDSVSETLDLQGNVYYSEDELALFSEAATLKLASDQAKLRDVMFIAPSAPLRGRSKAVYRDNKILSRYTDVAFTSCRPGNQDWVVHASELKINRANGTGSTKNAWVEFKGVPVFYSPYLSFPTDNRRLSGFLTPNFGSTQRSGFNISTPYYWNIAPNYDATFKPRYFSKRGVVLGGNARYLSEISNGIASMEYMPNDSIRNKSRYLASVKNVAQFTPTISSNIDLNYVSDKNYFAELGNALSIPNFSYLKSQADIGYRTEPASLVARVENYQSIDKAITKELLPYRKLPQVNLNLNHDFESMPLNTALGSEYVWFQHDYRVNGQRMNVKPSLSFPMQTTSAFLTPKLSLQHTEYILSNQDVIGFTSGISNRKYLQSDGKTYGTRTSDSISRTLPILSADGGLYFERDVELGNSSYLHTVEPRLFYLFIPKVNQQDIPIFDTALYDFGYNSLFRENRFSGTDRVQDANQVTTAVSSRLVDSKTGREKLKLSVGEIFYFRDREVNLPGYPVETNSLSNLVTDLNAGLTDHVSVETGVQWNPHTNNFDRHRVMFHYLNEPGSIFNIGYRYRKNTINPNAIVSNPLTLKDNEIRQTDMSFHWPLFDNWYAVGRWQYSLKYNSTQESFLGLEKENCCWKFSIIGRRYINNANIVSTGTTTNNLLGDVQGVSQTGLFFQIELKGLTGIGENLDQFFEQNISGYRKSEK